MARYDRQYDFGLRGYRQTTRPMMDHRYRPHPYDSGYRASFDERAYPEDRLANRVTARYTVDYVREQHPGEYPMNPYPYGGDREGRVGDFRQYNRPYHTVSGSNTSRGGGQPVGWERTSHRYDYLYRNRGDGGYDHRWF